MSRMPPLRAALPGLALLLLAAAPGGPARDHSAPSYRAPLPRAPLFVRPCAGAPPLAAPADSVRQLNVAIVLATNSFNKVLTPADVERVHEEVAEFYAFYQLHGAGKVDFRFSLIQVDRPLARREIAEVSPGRYYLSRDNLEAELAARGFRGRFDEVITLHAWSNANPDRALQAYGGGAVGPDGQFLGDAGFNSIPVMGRDPNTIGQVLIHEVLHNVDDMFSRSGMPDGFFNADEMSRNMAQLLRERPGAFLPRFSDAEMLAFADRERQGREGYPWALQLVYYGWMLERTPKAAWDRLRYGRMVPAARPAVRPLYAEIFTSVANDSTYLPVLAPAGSVLTADGGRLTALNRRLTARTYDQTDFDGTVIYRGGFYAAWVPLARGASGDSVAVAIRGSTPAQAPTSEAGRGRGGRPAAVPPAGVVTASALVVRQHVASVVAEPLLVRYVDRGEEGDIPARVLQDRLGGDGPPVNGARLTVSGPPVPGARSTVSGPPDLLALGTHDVTLSAEAPGWYVHPTAVRVVARRGWRVSDDGPLTVSLGSPLTVNAFVREDRGRDDVSVTATIEGRRVPLSRTGDGRYSVTVPGDIAPGLHWAFLSAAAPSGEVVTDSVRVYVRPAGWIRPPATFARGADGLVPVVVQVESRMGEDVRGAHLPLVAIVGDAVAPLGEADSAGTYTGAVRAPAGANRVILASLLGDIQRRVVEIAPAPAQRATAPGAANPAPAAPAAGAPAPPLPTYAAAIRFEHPPTVDGDLADWPATAAQPVVLGPPPQSYLLTDSSVYHGASDLSARLRFGWDDSTLYFAGEITDDSVTSGDAWDTDRVNFVFDMKHDTSPLTYASANPPLNEWQDDDYWVFFRYGQTVIRRFGKVNADPIPGARLATRRTAAGWAYEAAIPRAALPGYVPFVGQAAGLQVFVTDGDGERTATELMWSAKWPYTADGIEWRLAELATLLFVDAPLP